MLLLSGLEFGLVSEDIVNAHDLISVAGEVDAACHHHGWGGGRRRHHFMLRRHWHCLAHIHGWLHWVGVRAWMHVWAGHGRRRHATHHELRSWGVDHRGLLLHGVRRLHWGRLGWQHAHVRLRLRRHSTSVGEATWATVSWEFSAATGRTSAHEALHHALELRRYGALSGPVGLVEHEREQLQELVE